MFFNLIKKAVRGVFYLFVILAIYSLVQGFLYWKDDGVRVADSFTTPPLSQQFYVLFSPISVKKMDWYDKWSYWRAIKKFPTPDSCLKTDNQTGFSASEFDWDSIQNGYQTEVCLHHVSVKLADPVVIVEWLKSEGFDMYLLNTEGSDRIHLSGNWSVDRTGKLHPFKFFPSYGISVTIGEWIGLSPSLLLQMTFRGKTPTLRYTTLDGVANF